MKICGYNIIEKIDKRRTNTIGFRYIDNEIYVYSREKIAIKYLKEVISLNLDAITKPKRKIEGVTEYQNVIQDGGVIYIFEKSYTISFVKSKKERCYINNDYLIVMCGSLSKMRSLINIYIQDSLKPIIAPAIVKYAKVLKKSEPTYDFNNRKAAYAVCIPKRKHLEFSFHIISLSKNQIDYIVAHEMCHLVHANHSPNFYDLLLELRPDSNEVKKDMKKYLITFAI